MSKSSYPIERLKLSAQRAFLKIGLRHSHDINLTQDDGTIHIFTDGSFGQKTNTLGYAAIIKTHVPDDEIVLFDRRKRIQSPQGRPISASVQNKAAEIYAVVEGLNALPEGSDVIVHTDFMEIEAYLNLNILNDTTENRQFAHVWEELGEAQDRHMRTRAVRATDNERTANPEHRRLMRIAHNFAASESGSSNLKRFLTAEDEQKYINYIDYVDYDNVERKHAYSSPGANDVIDPSAGDNDPIEWPPSNPYADDDPQPY